MARPKGSFTSEIEAGTIFSNLTVIKEIFTKTRRHFMCKCICNKVVILRMDSLTTGNTKSCGCQQKIIVAKISTKHGLCKNPLYNVYRAMINRCENINNSSWDRYGGRGIKVCKEWSLKKEFKGLNNFIAWNASLPKNKQWKEGLELDRENNNKNYNAGNCRWVTPKVNTNNRELTKIVIFENRRRKFSDLYTEIGNKDVPYPYCLSRLGKGWSVEESLTRPMLKRGLNVKNKKTGT